MAEYNTRWTNDNNRRPQSPLKRPRRDYDRSYDRTGWGGRDSDQMTNASNILRNGLSFAGLSSELALPGVGLGVSGAASLSALGAGLSAFDDPTLITQTSQVMGYDNLTGRSTLGMNNTSNGLPHDASSTLFVDGLPSDCTRREAAHIFRPFIGFKEVRLVHKDAKRVTGEKLVLCFVEFLDAKCAATALEALQVLSKQLQKGISGELTKGLFAGYKFDETDPDSFVLRLTFARYGPRGGAIPRARSPIRVRDRPLFRRDRRR